MIRELRLLLCASLLAPIEAWAFDPLPPGASPGYLIVAPADLVDAGVLDQFVAFKTGLGFRVYVSTLAGIERAEAGCDTAEKIREHLKRAFRANSFGPSNVRYALLVGGGDAVPFRAIYPDWDPGLELKDQGNTRSDFYYADLTGDWDSNGDGFFGQGIKTPDPIDAADLGYEIAIGRLPFSQETSVETALEAIIAFERAWAPWKAEVLQLGAFMDFEGRAWVVPENEAGRYVTSKGLIGAGTDNAVLMEKIWTDVLEPAHCVRARLYETSLNPLGEPNSDFEADAALGEENIVATWNSRFHGLVAAGAHGEASGVSHYFWEWDRNENGTLEHPTEPIDLPEIDGLRSYSELNSDRFLTTGTLSSLDPALGGTPIVAIAGCGTAGFADFDVTDSNTSLGAKLVAEGKVAAFVGSVGTTGYSGGWDGSSTRRESMQDILLAFHGHLFTLAPRVGDAAWGAVSELTAEARAARRELGKGTYKQVLYGDPSMAYWGNAAAFAGPWPMFRHDSRNTGRGTTEGPAVPEVRWTFRLAPVPFGRAVSSPIVGEDGTIYAGSENGFLVAVNPDGSEKWRINLGGSIGCAPTLTVSGTLYVHSEDGFLHAVSAGGPRLWRERTAFQLIGAAPHFSLAPRVGPDGTIYSSGPQMAGGRVLSVRQARLPSGAVLRAHSREGGASGTPSLAPNGTVYFTDWGLNLDAFPERLAGDPLTFMTDATALGSPAVGVDGRIYFGTSSGRLFCLNPDLTERWHFDPPHGPVDDINSSPALGEDGSIYFGSWDNRIYCLEGDGSLRWEYDTGGPVDSSPALDSAAVYAVGGARDEARIFSISRVTGDLMWDMPIGGSALWGSSPAIGYDQTVYVVSSAGQLIAIGPRGATAAPSDVTATPVAPDRIRLDWRDNSPDEVGFRIERRDDSEDAFLQIATVGPDLTSVEDAGLEPAKTYFYRVRALASRPSGFGNEARARTPRPAPATPTGLSAEAESAFAIRIRWSPLDRHALGVRIERSTVPAGPFAPIGSSLAGSGTFLDENPEVGKEEPALAGDPRPEQTYYYRLRAFNRAGESAPSAVADAKTRGLGLPAPNPVEVDKLSSRRVKVTWADHATTEMGYVIERTSRERTGFERVASLPRDSLSYEDGGLESDFYTYRVRAVSPLEDSPFALSDEVQIARPAPPPALHFSAAKADGCGGTRLNLLLDSPEPVAGFQVGLEWLAAIGGGTPDPSEVPRILAVLPGTAIPDGKVQFLSAKVETADVGPGRLVIGVALEGGSTVGPGDDLSVLVLRLAGREGAPPGEEFLLTFRDGLGDPPIENVVSIVRGAATVSVRPSREDLKVVLFSGGDTTPPVITCPDDVAATCEGKGARVEFQVEATDTCGPVTVTCEPPSSSIFPEGETIVRCRAVWGGVGAAGIAAECSFRVRVASCLPRFRRGDPNDDGVTDITDGISILNYLFVGGAAPACLESGDVNDDAVVDITDGIAILNYLFVGGAPPTFPGPALPGAPCGADRDGSPSDLGCAKYASCPGT